MLSDALAPAQNVASPPFAPVVFGTDSMTSYSEDAAVWVIV